MKKPDYLEHARHKSIVRALRWKRIEANSDAWEHAEQFTVKSPYSGHRVSVSFSTYKGAEHLIYIRTTNWRAEDEPHGWAEKEEARKLYRKLLDKGFVKEE